MANEEEGAGENKMAKELLDVLNPHPYTKVVSNLNPKGGVDLRHFNRTRLAKNYWVNTKRFLNQANRIIPNGAFTLFGEYSGEDAATVRDNLIGWTYDNFRSMETYTGMALRQRGTDLRTYIETLRDEKNPADEIALYLLANMYRRHIFIYTKEWWWSTVLFVMPIEERDVIVKCDIVLVFIRPGAYGEVMEIRAPTLPEGPSKGHNTSSDTIVSVDTTEGHNKSLEFNATAMPSGPSMKAATRRLRPQKDKTLDTAASKPRRSPRKRKVLDYKDFVGGLEGVEAAGLTSPKRKKSRAPLKGPSRTRLAAQKKIQAARTKRLCSPPPPTRTVSTLSLPIPVVNTAATPNTEDTEAAQTLLSLSMDAEQPTTDEVHVSTETHGANTEPTVHDVEPEPGKHPVALEVNVIVNPPKVPTVNVSGDNNDDEQLSTKTTKKKKQAKSTTHFSMKSYSLKRKPDVQRKFKCRICPEILTSVHRYNYHYREKHPALPCPHCTRSFTSPRYLARHMYSHAEIMFECAICDKGFTFESQLVAHKRRHIKDTGYMCMKNNCGKSFKRDSELKAHVKTHRKTAIKCGHDSCTYSNKDIRNVRAHRKRHSEERPYNCPNCAATFKWQQQKKRHLRTCK